MPSVWFDGGALEQLRAYSSASEGAFAANTERARLSDSRIFAEWCHRERKGMLPISGGLARCLGIRQVSARLTI